MLLLEEQETELAALRPAVIEGETSGQSTPFDFEDFIARKARRRNSRSVTRYVVSPRAQADLDTNASGSSGVADLGFFGRGF